jgi:hypothetical protein
MVHLHSPATCPWDRMMAGLRSSFGHKKSVLVSGIKPRSFGFPARSLVTVLAEAQQLAYFLNHFPEAQRFVHNLTSAARSSCHHCHSRRPSGAVNDRLDIRALSSYYFAFGQFHCRCTTDWWIKPQAVLSVGSRHKMNSSHRSYCGSPRYTSVVYSATEMKLHLLSFTLKTGSDTVSET